MNLPVLTKFVEWHCAQKDEKSCVVKSIESTAVSQRLIHNEVRTEVCKEAVWRITDSVCCELFGKLIQSLCRSCYGSNWLISANFVSRLRFSIY